MERVSQIDFLLFIEIVSFVIFQLIFCIIFKE